MTGLGTGLPSLVTINMNHPTDDQHNSDQSTSTNDQRYNKEVRNNAMLNGNLTNEKINTNKRLGFVWWICIYVFYEFILISWKYVLLYKVIFICWLK